MVYEGSRSILGHYLPTLGASAAAGGFASGFGEFAGYGIVSSHVGRADRTGDYGPFTIGGLR